MRPRRREPQARAFARGTIVAAYRRHFAVRLDDGEEIDCVLKGRATAIACGDRVEVARVAGGGAIESILPRTNLIYRSDAFKQKLIAANVTLVLGVVAPDLPADFELIDRWGVAAIAERCDYLIVANKADLDDSASLVDRLRAWNTLGHEIVTVSALGDVSALARRVRGQRCVLVGESGMGKSTLLNALAPGAGARTAEISTALASGRHTTTETTLHPLPDESGVGWIVDSPGMKAFGLAHLPPQAIEEAFVDIRPFLGHCRFRDCHHDREPGCAVQAAVERGEVSARRLELLHEMVAESEAVRTLR